MSENIRFVTVTDEYTGISEEHVIIEFAPDEFRSMPKKVWDEQQKAVELGATL